MAVFSDVPVPVTASVKIDTNIKPGIQTTEFWSTLFMHLLTVVSMLLTLTGHTFHDTALTPLVPMAAMLASGAAQVWYSHTRANVKAAAIDSINQAMAAAQSDPMAVFNKLLETLGALRDTAPAAAPVPPVPPAAP